MKEKNIKNIQEYVKQELEKPNCEMGVFKKITGVKARQGKLGEFIETTMKNNHDETDNIVKKDPLTGQLDWVITNPDGEQYIVSDCNFQKKYEKDPQNFGSYIPKGKPIIALKINEDICFNASWGAEMHIKKDGYLNITEPNDIYGIQNEQFQNTYISLSDKNTDELNETLAEFYDLVVSFSSENMELPNDLNKIINEVINNYEALDNIEYNEPFRTKIQDNDKTLDEIINETSKPTVLWFSRHDMTPEQRKAIGGDRVHINQINKTIKSAYELKDEIEAADIIAIVARVDLQQQFLELANGKPVVMALSDHVLVPQPDGSEKMEFKFNKWEEIKRIKIAKEDFSFKDYINDKNISKENNTENER